MGQYSNLIATINSTIRQNGRGEITGPILNFVLNSMVANLGAGYQYMGMAVPTTNPGTPDEKVCYLATTLGTYTNFGNLTVAYGEIVIFKYDTSWHKETIINDLAEIRSGAAAGSTAVQPDDLDDVPRYVETGPLQPAVDPSVYATTDQLAAAVATLSTGYQYLGVATPATSPGTPDANVFYIAATPGTYTNFGGKVVADGEVAILKYNGSWTKEVTGAATAAQVTQLGQKVDGTNDTIGKYLDKYNIEQTDADWGYSDYIPYTPGNDVVWKFAKPGNVLSGRAICFYTADKTFISNGYWTTSGTTGQKTIPAASIASDAPNAAFIRASFRLDGEPSITIGNNIAWVSVAGLVRRMDAAEAEFVKLTQFAANAFLFPESDGTSESEAIELPSTGSMRFAFIPIEATPKNRSIFTDTAGSFFCTINANGAFYFKFNGSYLYTGIVLEQGKLCTFEMSWDGSKFVVTSGAYTGTIAYSTPMSETIKMYTRDSNFPLLSAQWLEVSLNGNSLIFANNFKFHKSREIDECLSLAAAAQSLYNPMRGVLFHHLNVEAAAADTIIPSQSLIDVRYAKALGFAFIEANIQKCSDNVLVVKHGNSGLLGAGVKLIGGGDCSTIAFSDVTSTWLRDNVVYDSVVVKYCTSIPTLDEFCKACREENVRIMIAGYSFATEALAVARKYLPDNMIMVSGLSARGDFKGFVNGWWSITSVDDAVAKLEQYGLPFVLGWRNYGSASSVLKEAVVSEMHKRGALVCTAYLKPAEVEVAKGFGVDMIASTNNEINPFNFGGLHNIHKLNDPALTFSSGAVYDSATDTIQMAAGSYIYLPNTDHSSGIVKMSVSIRYGGTLTIQPGTSSEYTEIMQYASDGSGFVTAGFTVERRANILRLYADTAVTIYDWLICASVVF